MTFRAIIPDLPGLVKALPLTLTLPINLASQLGTSRQLGYIFRLERKSVGALS